MCCFSGDVFDVSETRIFARRSGSGQYLVYEMRYHAEKPVAMILPLPVKTPASAPGTVRFIDLSGYRDFFADLFALGWTDGLPPGGGAGPMDAPKMALPVIDVGDFVASFVPAMDDFRRLDPRFSIAPEVWAKIPTYRDYGFAVFQLKASVASRFRKVAPMALEFQSRLPSKMLYFPTVHIHDGQVHPVDSFDHLLYAAVPSLPQDFPKYVDYKRPLLKSLAQWVKFPSIASIPELCSDRLPRTLQAKSKGILPESGGLARFWVRGVHANRDTFVELA